jgi:hypothetical protein
MLKKQKKIHHLHHPNFHQAHFDMAFQAFYIKLKLLTWILDLLYGAQTFDF